MISKDTCTCCYWVQMTAFFSTNWIRASILSIVWNENRIQPKCGRRDGFPLWHSVNALKISELLGWGWLRLGWSWLRLGLVGSHWNQSVCWWIDWLIDWPKIKKKQVKKESPRKTTWRFWLGLQRSWSRSQSQPSQASASSSQAALVYTYFLTEIDSLIHKNDQFR